MEVTRCYFQRLAVATAPCGIGLRLPSALNRPVSSLPAGGLKQKCNFEGIPDLCRQNWPIYCLYSSFKLLIMLVSRGGKVRFT